MWKGQEQMGIWTKEIMVTGYMLLKYNLPLPSFFTSIAAGEKWAWGHQWLSEVLPPYIKKTGLVHRNGPHFMKEPLGTSGLKEGAAGEHREDRNTDECR
jgi:hypothetical protein